MGWRFVKNEQKVENDPSTHLRPINEAERNGCKNHLLVETPLVILSAYTALKGYRCAYGRVPVDNARLIVEALEKAETDK